VPITITKDNHQEKIIDSFKPIVLDVYATWCGPCQLMNPIIDELETEYATTITFAKLNVDDSRELAIHYGITSIPTFIFIKNGQVITKETGSRTKKELESKITEYLIK